MIEIDMKQYLVEWNDGSINKYMLLKYQADNMKDVACVKSVKLYKVIEI